MCPIRSAIRMQWLEWLYSTPSMNQQLTKPFIDLELRKPWFTSCKTPRQVITIFTRLQSQHVTMNAHLHKINISESPFCNCEPNTYIEDTNHILFQCSKYDLSRKKNDKSSPKNL